MTMKEVVAGLEDDKIAFICTECGVTEEELFGFDDDELYDKVYDPMCDIECEETPDGNEPLNERGELAEYLVTELGNVLCEEDEDEEGYFSDDE